MTQPLSLSDGVQYVKGVGPARARLLEKLGVKTVADLLWLFPREYVDLREVKNVADLEEDQSAIVRGTVVYRKAHTTKAGVPVLEIECRDRTGVLAAVWFHRPDLSGAIVMGQEIQLTGKVKCVDTVWRMTNPKVRSAVDAPETPGVVPIYAMTEGLRADEIRAICRQALAVADQMPDLLPESFRVARGWMSAGQALRKLHEPRDIDEAESARRRLVYEEFLQFQLAFGVKRRAFAQRRGRIIQVSTEVDQRIRRLFGFLLTADQDAAIAELVDDLRGPGPMHRLVQGDVGTGKTAVAVYAILAVIAAGYQTAYMAPTEILARQQFRLLDDMLRQSRVRRRFLVGGLLPAERAGILDELFRGDVDLVVGTHALISRDVRFHNLALAVIDEQHKFGVRQRAELFEQEVTPHQLVLTATPIPRSLAMTWFGDLDVSTLKERPPGRGAVQTAIIAGARREQAYDFVAQEARVGRRSIVVCPRVEASENLRGAEQVFNELSRGKLQGLEVALVHGRMDENKKDEAVRRFRRGDVLVLVATVVVEVGLDVPGATAVVIENAERFGLSQLHQIRGRIGRGNLAGTCLLIDTSSEPEGSAKLKDFAATTDGFEIAELDVERRGFGDVLGVRQHGFVQPRIGDFQKDVMLLAQAKKDAQEILASEGGLRGDEWGPMRRALRDRFGKTLVRGWIG